MVRIRNCPVFTQSLRIQNFIGIWCGSGSIDQSFKEWVEERCANAEGSFAKTAQRLGSTEEAILDRATSLFQKHKLAFPRLLGVEQEIYIRGKGNEGLELPLDR